MPASLSNSRCQCERVPFQYADPLRVANIVLKYHAGRKHAAARPGCLVGSNVAAALRISAKLSRPCLENASKIDSSVLELK